MNFYNEHDPKAAAWLRELIAGRHIPAGIVDERSITEISPDELLGYTQCHFFAGIGGWSYALQLAGWPPSRRAWTGSCPCQPFSQAGKQMGRRDPRHLWPAFRRLINRCRPPIVFGEQVASADGRLWLAGVSANLETMGYATAAADLCAASVGAPHPRQRLYWMANDASERFDGAAGVQGTHGRPIAETSSTLERMGVANGAGRDTRQPAPASARYGDSAEPTSGWDQRLGNAESGGCGILWDEAQPRGSGYPIGTSWAGFEIVHCRDGKARRIESLFFWMAHGLSAGLDALWNDSLSQAKQEIISHAKKTNSRPNEIVRTLRDHYHQDALWFAVGGQGGVSEKTFLFAALCELSRELGGIIDGETPGVGESAGQFMPNLRTGTDRETGASCASLGWEYAQQFTSKLEDIMRVLPQEVASYLMHNRPLADGVPGRVGLLRGYGNAIVPQTAAEFIMACDDAVAEALRDKSDTQGCHQNLLRS